MVNESDCNPPRNSDHDMGTTRGYMDDEFTEQPSADGVVLNDSGYQTMGRVAERGVTSLPSDSMDSYTTAKYGDDCDNTAQRHQGGYTNSRFSEVYDGGAGAQPYPKYLDGLDESTPGVDRSCRHSGPAIGSIPSDSIESYTTAKFSDVYDGSAQQTYPTYPDDYNNEEIEDSGKKVVSCGPTSTTFTTTTTTSNVTPRAYEMDSMKCVDVIGRSNAQDSMNKCHQQDSTEDPYLTPTSALAPTNGGTRGPIFPLETDQLPPDDIKILPPKIAAPAVVGLLSSDSQSVPSLAKLRWLRAFAKISDQLNGVSRFSAIFSQILQA